MFICAVCKCGRLPSVVIPHHKEIKTQHSRILNNYVLNDGLHYATSIPRHLAYFVHSLTFNSLTHEAFDSYLSLQDTPLYWLTADFQMTFFSFVTNPQYQSCEYCFHINNSEQNHSNFAVQLLHYLVTHVNYKIKPSNV